MAESLDQQIVDAGSLVSVLLVFVFAYFSTLLPTMADLKDKPTPNAKDDKAALARRIRSYEIIGTSLALVTALVSLLLLPLSLDVVRAQPWRGRFDTVRLALLLVEVLLLVTSVAITWQVFALCNRRRELR